MKKRSLLFFSIIILFFSNCQDNANTRINNPKIEHVFKFSDFPNNEKIFLQELNINTDLSDLTNYKSFVLISNYTDISALSVFSKKKEKLVKKEIKKGKGPNEILAISGNGILNDSIFWTYEAETYTVRFYEADDIVNKIIVSKPFKQIMFDSWRVSFAYKIIPLSIDRFFLIGCPIYKSKITIIDENSNPVDSMGEYFNVYFDNLRFLKSASKYEIALKPDKKIVALGYLYSDVIEIYDLQNKKMIKVLHGPDNFTIEPKPNFKNANRFAFDNDKTRQAYWIQADDNYIYALYWGTYSAKQLPYGNKLLVFDWKGNLIKYFTLSENCETFCIDNINNKIFLTTESANLAVGDFNIE